ncbi:hypothetical protein MTP04_06470 [Lysinibacillus sp. PLM2]|nr:hypothetical protein MTP04_06470 [Lysinibacillus sp. PLM2]
MIVCQALFLIILHKNKLTNLWKDDFLNGTITHFYGRALTGQGMKNVYKELMNEAKQVYLLKGGHGFKISKLLTEIGIHYHNKNANIEYFHDPLFENTIEALFVKEPHHLLFLYAVDPSFENTKVNGDIQEISLDDCLDSEKMTRNRQQFQKFTEERQKWHDQCFQALANALTIHDDWEVETRRYMEWDGLNKKIEQLFNDVFQDKKLNKEASETHRLLGTLTPAGARDTVQSITQSIEKRYFIKGYPGTGKSSMMKSLAKEALNRGFDVQKVWCGLDSNSIDMVIIPELNFCIFDSTEPHVYFPDTSRNGDEIFDIAQFCHPTEVEEENIKRIVSKYRATMQDAVTYANLYAEAEKGIREIIDDAIDADRFKTKLNLLID